jgi:hypothetical protein
VVACLMRLRAAAGISLTAALASLPAAAHAADVVRPSSVTGRIVVPEGGASTVRLHCPSSAVALNGAVTRRGAGVTVRRSSPGDDPGSWGFRVAAAEGASHRAASMVLRCVRLELPAGLSSASLQLNTRRESDIRVPAGGTVSVQVRCGAAWIATGYGLDRGTREDVLVDSAVPTAHGWDFVLENTRSTTASVSMSARCLKRIVTADGGSAQLRFRAARPSFEHVIVTGGTPTLLHSCGPGRFSLATGFTLDPLDPIELGWGSPVRRRGGRWTLRRASAGDRVSASLVCLNEGSGFR